MKTNLNNEGQELKEVMLRGERQGGQIKRMKKDKNGLCVFYTCMNMEY
jgi:hypothetical protein